MHVKLLFLAMLTSAIFAKNTQKNFNDFVKEERRLEILQGAEQRPQAVPAKSPIIPVFLVSAAWIALLYYSRKSQNSSDKAQDISTLCPIEISAVMGTNSPPYDIIAVFFDLIVRKNINLHTVDGELQFCFDNKNDLQNFEDFFAHWFFGKIGGGTFTFGKLREYISISSQAVQFDIDFDVWSDEVNEVIKNMGLADANADKIRLYNSILCVVSTIVGTVALYFTNSLLIIIMFVISFLSYKTSTSPPKTSKKHGELKKNIISYKKMLLTIIETDKDFENEQKWDKIFIQSIPLELSESLFEVYDKYKSVYEMMEEELYNAIRYTSEFTRAAL